MPARRMALAAGFRDRLHFFVTTRATLCFLRYSIVWAIIFGVVGFVLVLDKDENGDDEVCLRGQVDIAD